MRTARVVLAAVLLVPPSGAFPGAQEPGSALGKGQGKGRTREAVHGPGKPRLPHAQGASVLKADIGEDKGPRASDSSPELQRPASPGR